MNRKTWIAIVVLLLLLVITNPTLTDFKEASKPLMSIGGINLNTKYCFRKSNYLLFSEYENADGTYLGLLKNFYKISGRGALIDTAVIDTSAYRK
ncbi:MAG TPA: hypothetical protein VNW95_09265 [Mucilaginibacter sp.]|jgi:hypothetical protein|nr:hypothetical protein [Mucilaginibacter sp.]